MSTKKFWMVAGLGPSSYRHMTAIGAKNEAERLALQNPGREFYVLESVAVAVRRDVTWEPIERVSFSAEDDVPF